MRETQASLNPRTETAPMYRSTSRFDDWTPTAAYAHCQLRAAVATQQWKKQEREH